MVVSEEGNPKGNKKFWGREGLIISAVDPLFKLLLENREIPSGKSIAQAVTKRLAWTPGVLIIPNTLYYKQKPARGHVSNFSHREIEQNFKITSEYTT